MQELTTIKFDSLPLQNAILIKKGDGSCRFAVFTDPDCPHCTQSREKCEAIWCASDKAAAWHDWMINQKLPEKSNGTTPIDDNLKLAQDLGLAGTPTIYLSNGAEASQQELLQAIGKKA